MEDMAQVGLLGAEGFDFNDDGGLLLLQSLGRFRRGVAGGTTRVGLQCHIAFLCHLHAFRRHDEGMATLLYSVAEEHPISRVGIKCFQFCILNGAVGQIVASDGMIERSGGLAQLLLLLFPTVGQAYEFAFERRQCRLRRMKFVVRRLQCLTRRLHSLM